MAKGRVARGEWEKEPGRALVGPRGQKYNEQSLRDSKRCVCEGSL